MSELQQVVSSLESASVTTPQVTIPFNKPFMTGHEVEYILRARANGHLSGDGPFTKACHRSLEKMTGSPKALLTHSCTAALEMAALLLNLQPGDEVIMPSFTFVSTANAFVLRGATPVFVDIRPDTLNVDENLIEAAISPRTKAICVVHYAGVSCEMDAILAVGARHGIAVIEDAAQGIMAAYKSRPLGGIGEMGALSFHETKNVIAGEGGALLVNSPALLERAEVIREKGTNRSKFFRGQVDKYTWVDLGSSFLPSELIAAFLAAQLEDAQAITSRRLDIWSKYHQWAEPLEKAGLLRRPVVPGHCTHNAHMYYVLLPDLEQRTAFLAEMRKAGIGAVFHYIPLHSSPAGRRLGKSSGELDVTASTSDRLVRLPLWLGVEEHLPYVFDVAEKALRDLG
ncbi:dTDP-4-amino-4,6-dideoxygalactose transaminase [Luteimonas cucumeris]|uniref:dTDP-4-amino-4,6-dideoxygalactose transaminase n=1 Tax=Luteimonas cucumeris TaxID=985012 RepID=A0A562L5T0_9GAMM|nr:dTDP-4-amino-4,6-dideoxygalactose transaminase [Luteimonas cucumeris]TWI02973.1 dTDP-4-amino-4,6-dideoxygalactose transaminase [Luteimonas cucumeris]